MIAIIENGVQMTVSNEIAELLRSADLIYNSGQGFDHLTDGVTWEMVDTFIDEVVPSESNH